MAKTKTKTAKTRTGANSSAGIGIFGGLAVAAGAAVIGYLTRNRWAGMFGTPAPDGHPAPDLAPDKPHPGPHDRAPEHFRPDPTAVPTAEEREALRPATGTGPTLVKGQADELVRANAAPS